MIRFRFLARDRPLYNVIVSRFVHQLAGEGSGHFDIGEMAFDATFDHDYGEHEVSRVCRTMVTAVNSVFVRLRTRTQLRRQFVLALWAHRRTHDH